MIYSFSARIYLMMTEGITYLEAFDWVCRRINRNLKPYYKKKLYWIVVKEEV